MLVPRSKTFPGLLLLATACVPAHRADMLSAQNAALAAQVSALQSQLDETEAKLAVCESSMASARPMESTPELEAAASALLEQIDAALDSNHPDQARELFDTFKAQYSFTRAARARSSRLEQEMSVVGMSVRTPELEKWYQGSPSQFKLEKGLTVLVFWEAWCPHCQRELPLMQELYGVMQKDLQVVALTKVTKSSTDEKVQAFIAENGLSFPVAKEDGSVSTQYAVTGIPAAALVKDGVVVWRGHPARLSVQMLQAFL